MTILSCRLPWDHLMIGMAGEYRICNLITIGNGIPDGIYDKNGNPCTILTHDPYEAIDSINHSELRSGIVRGEKRLECRKCFDLESHGCQSLRLSSMVAEYRSGIFDGTIKIRELDLRFGNRCNARCVMCSPTNSDQWYDDFVEITGRQLFKTSNVLSIPLVKDKGGKYNENHAGLRWYENPKAIDRIKCLLPDIRYINFSGGEPLLIEQHRDLLESAIQLGYSKDIILHYKTNLSFIPPWLVDMWKKFKKVIITASIDGIGCAYEYIRYPLSWTTFEQNVKSIISLESNNIELSFGCTLSAITISSLVSMNDWICSNFGNLAKISSTVVRYPLPLRIENLPNESKIELLGLLSNKTSNIEQHAHQLLTNSMTVTPNTASLVSWLDGIDRLRQTNWKTSIPDMTNLIFKN